MNRYNKLHPSYLAHLKKERETGIKFRRKSSAGVQSWALGADSSGKHDIYSLGENFKQLFVRPVTHCLLFSAVKSLYCELIGVRQQWGSPA